jgi:predicted dehydrogenase
MTEKLKVALIGCGRMGYSWNPSVKGVETYSHFAAINQCERFELVAVADTNPDILAQLKKHDVLECGEDWRRVLGKRESWDLVVIATPDETHPEIMLEMTEFKPRCVFAEKPLCLNSQSGERIIKSFESAGISLLVNYSRRFMSEYRALRDEIREGRMGTPLCLTIHYTGGLAHNGFHFLDLAHWFFGAPEQTNVFKRTNCEATPGAWQSPATIHCTYKSGLQFNLIGIGHESPTHHQIEFIGSEGGFRILNNERIECLETVAMERFEGFRKFTPGRSRAIKPGLALRNAYLSIANHLDNQVPLERTSKDCLALNYMIEQGEVDLA